MESFIDHATLDRAVCSRVTGVYRRLILDMDAAGSVQQKSKYRELARRLRNSWVEWADGVCLHELTFGEPLNAEDR